jgi:hypothetical protein
MNSKERLIQELETLPEQLIDEILDYMRVLKNRHALQTENAPKPRANFDEEWGDNLAGFTPDFCTERKQPELPNREDIFL